jgi:hypothetical protein
MRVVRSRPHPVDEEELLRNVEAAASEGVVIAQLVSSNTPLISSSGDELEETEHVALEGIEKRSRELRVAAKMVAHDLEILSTAEERLDNALREIVRTNAEVEKNGSALVEALLFARRSSGATEDVLNKFEATCTALSRLDTAAIEARFAYALCRSAYIAHMDSASEERELRSAVLPPLIDASGSAESEHAH